MVLTYPQVLERDADATSRCAIANDDRDRLVDFIRDLNGVIGRAVDDARASQSTARKNADIQLVDMWDVFDGHGGRLCSEERPRLMNGITTSGGRHNSFHPTIEGYRVESVRLRRAIEKRLGVGRSSVSSIDTVLAIDSSGSMAWNDASDQRLAAANLYVGSALPGDHVGIVDFDSVARILSDPVAVPAATGTLHSLIGSINSSGGTDIGAAVEAACLALSRSQSTSTNKAALLLTDGEGDYSGEAQCFVDRGWRLFTIGFGDADAALLSTIATRTGGRYIAPTDTLALGCEFQNVRAEIASGRPTTCVPDLINLGETLIKRVLVPLRTIAVTFAATWPGSDVQMTLVSPSGARYTRESDVPEVIHELGATYEVFTVLDPEPGDWTVELHGADIAVDGEPLIFVPTIIPYMGTPPTARITAMPTSGSMPLTVRFDSASSGDADGSAFYFWDFGDGSEPSMDRSATHTYETEGEYEATIFVRDEQGEQAVAAAIITVGVAAAEAPAADPTPATTHNATPTPLAQPTLPFTGGSRHGLTVGTILLIGGAAALSIAARLRRRAMIARPGIRRTLRG